MALEKIRLKHGSPEWLAFRRTGIGGSDAAAILGLSPFKSNIEVWEEKVGLREPEDISDKPQVQYGTRAEDMLVKLFALDYPQYKVRQDKQTVYRRGFMFASLDGELTEIETKARGFIEIKTTEIHSAAALQKWDGHVPEYYYAQVLHYFVTLGWTFAWLKVQIKQTGRNEQTEFITRHYPFLRRALMEDMKYLYMREKEFWGYVERKQRPPRLLPPINKE